MKVASYLEIRETAGQLPDIQLEGAIGLSGSELRRVGAGVHFRSRERPTSRVACYDAFICGELRWERNGSFKVDKKDPWIGWRNLHVKQRLGVPLNQEIVSKCILEKMKSRD